jgi:predicted dinucleotide-binding enzyme
MNIAVIGAGRVGGALAVRLRQAGHQVVLGGPDPASDTIRAVQNQQSGLVAKPTADAVAAADVVFLAIPFPAVQAVLTDGGDFAGKIIVDCTNPVGPGIAHGLGSKQSGAETVQAAIPGAAVVKAFTIYGFENLRDSHYPGYGALRPAMLVAGDDESAKSRVSHLATDLGFEPVDAGPLASSLHLEHMTLLWIKMARVQGRGADFVWARLTR